MTTKKKKSAKQKRVLIAAVVVAVAIVAGSTFAWFSSKDEVTNRLSASANYNVAIAEDFQAPEDWIPGQTINKDVAAVNAGNVDAFVRMWLGGQMRLLNESSATDKVDAKSATATGSLTEVTDESKNKLGLNYKAGSKYYKTLSTEKINNPQDTEGHSATGVDEEGNQPAEFSEVQTVQAGGVLVYAPANAKYHWTLEQAADMIVYNSGNPTEQNLAKGTVVGSVGTSNTTVLAGTTTPSGNYYGTIDASTFQPETTGLYLFRRTVFETADGTENKYEYSGYYFDKTKFDANKPAYFALHTGTGDNGNSDYVLPTGSVTENNTATPSKDQVLPVSVADSSVFLFTATETLLDDTSNNKKLNWTYVAPDTTTTPATPARFDVTYTAVNNKPITITVQLANVGTGNEEWTAIGSANDNTTTFYYNNDVEAGDTTAKLVDSVKLSDDTKVGAYLAFDFDLDVFMESVQVTMTENGLEGYDSVTNWAATTANNPSTPNIGAKGEDSTTARTSASEITNIKWTAVS